MRVLVAFLVLLGVAACGADDPPIRPTANVGVSIGPNGITPNASVGARRGILSVGLNL